MIPVAVVEVVASVIASDDGWGFQATAYEETARAAILAALQAWPGARGANQIDGVVTPIILPLPTKETDA